MTPMDADSITAKITVHMVASLDGYIARKDGSVNWMESHDYFEGGKVLTDEAIQQYLKQIDCYVIGSSTYEHALKLGWPYGDKPVYVLTRRKLNSERTNVIFWSASAKQLIHEQLRTQYQNIWMAGGARLTQSFIQQKLADYLIVSLLPVILGDGVPFFARQEISHQLRLEEVTPYEDGMVELCYSLIKD